MGEAVNIPTEYAVLEVPSQAVEIKISAKVYLDGEIRTVETTYDFDKVRNAIKEAEDYIDPDTVFMLTEKGKQYVKEMGCE